MQTNYVNVRPLRQYMYVSYLYLFDIYINHCAEYNFWSHLCKMKTPAHMCWLKVLNLLWCLLLFVRHPWDLHACYITSVACAAMWGRGHILTPGKSDLTKMSAGALNEHLCRGGHRLLCLLKHLYWVHHRRFNTCVCRRRSFVSSVCTFAASTICSLSTESL